MASVTHDPAEIKRIVGQVQLMRGAFIGSYAQVEFLLADICVKTWEIPEYASLKAKFPYRAESRIKAANALFESNGRLAKYREEVRGLFQELLRFEEVRDFMAHGLLRIDTRSQDFSVHMRMYRPVKGGLQIGTLDMPVMELAGAVQQIVPFTHGLVTTFKRIYLEQNLQAFAAEIG